MKGIPVMPQSNPAEPRTGWVEAAARLPVAFAQVREDPLIDRALIELISGRPAVLMIASGGCTAARLATARISRLHLVDVNPAQIALARLKLYLLQSKPQKRLQLLGHAPMPADERKAALRSACQQLGLAEDVLGPLDFVAECGLDHCGRYEAVFARLREQLQPVREELDALLALRDLDEQTRRAAPATALGGHLDAAFDCVMDLPNLIALFGPNATANRVQPFSRHFAGRTRHVLATMPAATNPYLHQMLRGRFPETVTYPWIDAEVVDAAVAARLPPVTWNVESMNSALQSADANAFDLVYLSNILDWLSPPEAQELLRLATRALRPGGIVVIRQLNSRLDIRGIASGLIWDEELSARLHAHDRSFFYLQLHVGTRRE